MKKITLLVLVVVLTLVSSACSSGPEKINGLVPADIPVLFITAFIQGDEKKQVELIDADLSHMSLNPEQGPQNDNQLDNYGLIEWKFDENTYYYKLEYFNPYRNNLRSFEKFKIIETEEGWKAEDYLDPTYFEEIVAKLEESKKVIRELSL